MIESLFVNDVAPTSQPQCLLGRNLGVNVMRLRVEQALNKKTFAQMSGISRPLLDDIENGTSDVRLSCVQQLADALSVEPLDLLEARFDVADGSPALRFG